MEIPIKILLNLTLIFSFNAAFAQYVVSPYQPHVPFTSAPPPSSGQNFFLWSRDSGCYTSDYTVDPRYQVQILDNTINIFFQAGLGGSTICVSPTPPIYLQRAEIDGVDAGNYILNVYGLPYGDDFPPAISDYSSYFIGNIQFGVVEPAIMVDSTTNIGLTILILLTLITGLYFSRMSFINKLTSS